MFTVVQNEKFYMQIVQQLRAGIADGSLAAGSRLPTERELTSMFGASRASIREALSALEILGAIESRGGRGKYINARTSGETGVDERLVESFFKDDSAFELFEARLEIEPDLAALAAERAGAAERKALGRQLHRMEEIQRRLADNPHDKRQAVDDYLAEDRRFHLMLGASSHNAVLYRFSAGIHHMLHGAHWKLLKRKVVLDAESMKRLNREHGAILSAVLSGNPRLARAVMTRHLEDLREVLF